MLHLVNCFATRLYVDERLENPPGPSTIYYRHCTAIDKLPAVFVCVQADGSRFTTVAALPRGAVCLLLCAVACRPKPRDSTGQLFVYKHCVVRCIQSFIHAVAATTVFTTSLLRCET